MEGDSSRPHLSFTHDNPRRHSCCSFYDLYKRNVSLYYGRER